MLNRQIKPASHAIEPLHLVQPTQIDYPNGLQCFVFPDPQVELVRFEFVFNNVFSDPEFPLRNTVLASMLREGTRTRNSTAIAEQIDFYGAYLIPEFSLDHTSLTVYTMRKYVDKIMHIVFDVLTESIIPQKELDTFIRNNKQSLKISLKKNDVVARRVFFGHLFGDNRYGFVPVAEDYDRINREDLIQLYREQIQPANCTLFLSGRVDAEVLQQVRELFGENWIVPEKLTRSLSIPLLQEASSQLLVEQRDDALQSAIRMGQRTIGRAHEDFPAIQFVNTLLGGFFGSRLMRNIREDKGYTYGIGSSVSSLQHSGIFMLSSEVGVSVTQATLTEIQKEFEILRQEKAQQEEVALVRSYLQGVMLGSLESIFSHADKFKAAHFSGLDLNYYAYYSDVIANITADDVQDIAIRYFNYDSLLKVVVGKLA